jgi:RND family efflux transporter MFP subunit
VRARQEATLYAKVAGYLKTITEDKGDAVKANSTIAVLETPELDADVIRYRAEVSAAKSEYDRLSSAVSQAPDLVVPVELDRAKGRYDVANANLQRTQSLLGFGRVIAPFAGVVTRRFVDPGAFIPAASGGAPQTAAIVTLMNFSTVRVQVAVPEAESSLVKKGQPVRFSVEGLPDRKFETVVTRYAYALDENSKTMMVEAEVPNKTLELRPGMYASVRIALEHREKVLLIPVAALVMEKANGFAFVAVDGVARKRPIKMGFNDGANVQVVDGLTETDSVLLPSKKPLSDGQKIAAAGAK